MPAELDNKTNWELEAEMLRMRNNAGEAFERFVKALRQYSANVTDAVTDAPAENILGAQGQARAVKAILRKFEDVLNK